MTAIILSLYTKMRGQLKQTRESRKAIKWLLVVSDHAKKPLV